MLHMNFLLLLKMNIKNAMVQSCKCILRYHKLEQSHIIMPTKIFECIKLDIKGLCNKNTSTASKYFNYASRYFNLSSNVQLEDDNI